MKKFNILYLWSIITLLVLVSCRDNPVENEDGNSKIVIKTAPRGAAIFVDGLSTGKVTPDSLVNLYSGSYSVKLKLFGYRDTTFMLNLEDSDSFDLLVELKQIF